MKSPEDIRAEVTRSVLSHDYGVGPLLLLAGPGTGKTYCLLETINCKVGEGLNPDSLFEATLTNASADDFLKDVQRTYPSFTNSSTLHFRAKGILHQYADRVGHRKDFLVFQEEEIDVVLIDLGVFLDRSMDFAVELRAYKEKSGSDGEISGTFPNAYESLKRFYNAVDWFDVVRMATSLLVEYDDVRANECSKFEFLLIDEYQDLNGADQRFVKTLLDGRTRLLAVGDDDQSIYSGRFADPSGITTFNGLYPDAIKIILPVCSRCPTAVIDASYSLVANNSERERKPKLIPLPKTDERASGGFVISVNLKSEKSENEFVGNALRLLHEIGTNPDEILVLCLNKDMGSELFEEIKVTHAELPLRNTMGSKVGQPQEQLSHYLYSFLANLDRSLALRMILERVYGNPDLVFSRMVRSAIDQRFSLWQLLNYLEENNKFGLLKDELSEFVQAVRSSVRLTEPKDRSLLVCRNLPPFNHLIPLMPIETGEAEKTDTSEGREKSIRFMTLHSSKGLDADFVFVPFMENDLSLPARDEQEQRRLLYVAMTRAKVGVVFSWAWSRKSNTRFKAGGGPYANRKPHRFISECRVDHSGLGGAFQTPYASEQALEILHSVGNHVLAWKD